MKFKKKTGDSAEPPKSTFGESSQPQIGSVMFLPGGVSELSKMNSSISSTHSKTNSVGFIRKVAMPTNISYNEESNPISLISTIQKPENNSLNVSQTYSDRSDDIPAKLKIRNSFSENPIVSEQIGCNDYSVQLPQISNYDQGINYNNSNSNDSQISESNRNLASKTITSNELEDNIKTGTNSKSILFGLDNKVKPKVF